MRGLWRASALPVLRRPFLGLVAAAVILILAGAPVLDDGLAMPLLQGVAVLLAAALTVTVDDPSGEVLGASPHPRWTRVLARASVGLAVVVPVWLLGCGLAEWRGEQTPILGLSLQAASLAVAALAIAAVLWARGTLAPSWLALTAVVGFAVLVNSMPRAYAMFGAQPWGPPWQAGLLRWAALLVLAGAVLSLAVRDPWDDHARRTLADRPQAEGANAAARPSQLVRS